MAVVSPIASVVIPAHNEAATIGRRLAYLYQGVCDHELEVLVVCNGCSDDTAVRAREAATDARVLEVACPSRAEARRIGDASSAVFPRVHLDADVVLAGGDLRRLVAPVRAGTVLAAAPRRVLVTQRSSLLVRWYYDVWEHLPRVTEGLFGRGAVALSAEAQDRVDALPDLVGDDVAVSDAFSDDERMVVQGAEVHVLAPRHLSDLVRHRVQVVVGNAQADAAHVRRPGTSTSFRDLLHVVAAHPLLTPKVPVFLAVTALSRLLGRRALHRDASDPAP